MSHPLKASTCLDSLLHLDSGRSVMLLSVLEWATILICPGLRCFLGRGTFSANTGSVLGKLGFSVTYLVLCTALWDELMDIPPPPLRGTNSPLCSSYTQESLHRGNTKYMSVERMKERMTFPGFQNRSVTYPGRRTGLGTRRMTPLLTGCVNFCQVINSLLRSFLICKEGQGLRSLLCYTFEGFTVYEPMRWAHPAPTPFLLMPQESSPGPLGDPSCSSAQKMKPSSG